MLVLLFVGLLIGLVSRQSILAVTGIQNGAGNLFRDVLSPVALAAFLALLLLVLRSMVLGRYQDSR
jgi:ACR3 family arsenite efflux pump ArsB